MAACQPPNTASRYLHPQQQQQEQHDNQKPDLDTAATSSGGAPTNSINRRSRGRPSGSKNKPKPPIIVTQDSPGSLRSHVLEITDGADIVESVSIYARKRGRGICVLSGNGTVANVTLRQPGGAPSTVLTLHGRFEIISLSGTVLPSAGAGGLSIFLAGGQGRVAGGSVVGPLLALGPVVLMVASFSNAVFERLPLEKEEEKEEEEGRVAQAQQQTAPSQSSGVTGGGGKLGEGGGGGGGGGANFFNMGVGNVNVGSYPAGFTPGADLFGWNTASGSASTPPF